MPSVVSASVGTTVEPSPDLIRAAVSFEFDALSMPTGGEFAILSANEDQGAIAALQIQPAARGGLNYGLSLNYNSNVWSYWNACVDRGEPAPVSPGELPLFVASPNPDGKASLGWSINSGRIVLSESFFGDAATPDRPEVTTYFGPDESSHAFHASLHATRLTEESVTGVEYTRDGSYLRLRSEPTGCHVFAPPETLSEIAPCVTSIDLPAFGRARAIWSFEYALQSVDRHRFRSGGGIICTEGYF